MPQSTFNTRGELTSTKGSEAGKDKKYDEIAENAEREAYRKKRGLAGLGSASKRANPTYKAEEEAHIKEWRAKRAQRSGQIKAVTQK